MSIIDDFIESAEHTASSGFGNSYAAGTELSAGFGHADHIMLETGYISTNFVQNDSRIFSLDRVQFQFPAPLVAMVVSNNILTMALETNHVLRIDLQQAHEVEDIEIPRKPSECKIHKLFFDPTGRHLLITTDHSENFYLYEKWKKVKLLSKLKGVILESVAWNPLTSPTDPSTLPILLGTRTGLIYETTLEPTEDFFRREEKYLKQVYSIHDSSMPITGLHFEKFPASQRKFFVVATTPTKIYQFVGQVATTVGSVGGVGGIGGTAAGATEEGRAIFEGLFSKYDVHPVQELPGNLSHSELHFFSQYQDLHQRGTAQTFAWLTGPGIYHGSLVFGSQDVGDSVIDSALLLPYPATSTDAESSKTEVPLSIALTKFHFILLYKDRVRAINQLNDQIVYEEMIPLSPGQQVRALTVDSVKNTFWVYTNDSVHELLIVREERDVWRLYLEKKQYDTALQHCNDPAQRDRVVTTQANDYFAQGRYQLSARYYAESAVPFEEVALKFVEREERDALRRYLLAKLERLKKGDQTQKAIIATWLVEVFLSTINELEDLATSSTPESSTSDPTATNEYRLRQRELEDEFRTFLDTYRGSLHRGTTYKLISSHGRTDELLYYATLVEDYDKVIAHWIEERKWDRALEVLSKQAGVDVYYKSSPVLMENAPYETVNVWMRQPNLNPRLLIPALLKYDHSKLPEGIVQNQAIRYLSYVVSQLNNTDPAIHNFLLTLHATQATRDEQPLLKFLKNEDREMHYNLDYALRLCSQNGRVESCVHIYSNMGLYEEAVNLALKHHNLALAQSNADKPEDDDALRKKLWLNIARHVVEEKNDIKKAMEYLKQCDLLKIEDILPFFPDFVLIDDFKDEISSALEEYNVHIEDLKSDMNEATKSAENIRLDIKELRSRFAIIQPAEKCNICNFPLLSRQFYIFPCQHAFHADCLIQRITKFLNARQFRRIVDLQAQLEKEMQASRSSAAAGSSVGSAQVNQSLIGAASNRIASAAGGIKDVIFPSDNLANGDDVTVVVARSEQLKEELDDIVASECLLCGDFMIKTIDAPFVSEDEGELTAGWAV